jgi:hypothetical protein
MPLPGLKRLVLCAAAICTVCAVLGGGVSQAGPDVLPLALDDAYRIEKVVGQTVDPEKNGRVTLASLKAELERRYFGAINAFERRMREGNYFNVSWRAPKGADVTVRLEYRQRNLGANVLSSEVHYPSVRGRGATEFSVLGEDYYQDGPVVAWRILLIEKGRIVGVQQSFLW